jgi:DNA-binding transcriptional ArsR family regulator
MLEVMNLQNEFNNGFFKVISHPARREIVECLLDRNLSFIELLNMIGKSNHGDFGYHLRILKEFVELEPSSKKYRLTYKGRLLTGVIKDFRSITSVHSEYARYAQNLRLGDHALLVYTNEDFKNRLIFPYLKAGLLKKEAVAYLVSENKLDLKVREAKKHGIDLDNLEKEAFTLKSAYEWFIEKGKAKSETIISNWTALVEEKKKAGFTGLRAAAEMEVFVDYAKATELLRYEELLGRQFNMDVVGLCLYDFDRYDNEQFVQACRAHGHIISKGIVGKMIL